MTCESLHRKLVQLQFEIIPVRAEERYCSLEFLAANAIDRCTKVMFDGFT